jgi:hypothetical protein
MADVPALKVRLVIVVATNAFAPVSVTVEDPRLIVLSKLVLEPSDTAVNAKLFVLIVPAFTEKALQVNALPKLKIKLRLYACTELTIVTLPTVTPFVVRVAES